VGAEGWAAVGGETAGRRGEERTERREKEWGVRQRERGGHGSSRRRRRRRRCRTVARGGIGGMEIGIWVITIFQSWRYTTTIQLFWNIPL
jgi:hypothetical protein